METQSATANTMQLFVTIDNNTTTLEVEASATILQVKQKIQENEGGPPEYQLMYADQQLEDEKTLAEYAIQPESTLQMIPARARKMQIFVKFLHGKTIAVDVAASDTIQQVKEIFQTESGIPADQMRFGKDGKTLEDGRTLDDYNIRQGSTIYVLLRLRC